MRPCVAARAHDVVLKFEADVEVANKQIAGLTHKARQDAGVPV